MLLIRLKYSGIDKKIHFIRSKQVVYSENDSRKDVFRDYAELDLNSMQPNQLQRKWKIWYYKLFQIKKMNRNIAFFFISILNLNFQNNLNHDTEYIRALNFFDQELVNHFPRKGKYKSFSLEVDTSAYYNTVSITATLKLSEKECNSIYGEYEKFHSESKNANIVVVNSFLTYSNFPEPSTIFCGEDCINKTKLIEPFFVLPNFYFNDFHDPVDNTQLDSQFEHIFLSKKCGIFSNKIKQSISTMPLGCFHGFSKGISINKKDSIVIYWLIIW